MAFIFETPNFLIESHEQPFLPRDEGGHVRISVKDETIVDRTKLTSKLATELMRLSMIVGEALEVAMGRKGVPIIKVNYHDMGNWSYKEGKKPCLHYHIFGRVLGAQHQPFPESMYLPDRSTGFYNGFEPLNTEDIKEIKLEIEKLFLEDKYLNKNWGL